MIINFTPTGMVPTKADTPNVPVTSSEIIEQVHEAFETGITMVHLHARENNEKPSYRKSIYAEIFEGIRKHCPALVLCASTSGRTFPELEKRAEVLSLEPDMASLTLSSMNFPVQASINSPNTVAGLINEMAKYGVKPELECFDTGMINYANYLIRKGLLNPPFYFNIILGNIATGQADPAYVGLAFKELPDNSYWALGGIGRAQLQMNTMAIAFGGGVRVGIEDNIWFDRYRTKPATNISLIKRIHRLAKVFERQVMKPETFGNLGFYNTKRLNK
ncbi:MAG: 3-keto-5-aminohexanoate cleavage protein [Prolixibacteraceae bacterium]|nr:3-keto-5-aminohexanoate cleavage protein [Prolixibacteraceae bacterium]